MITRRNTPLRKLYSSPPPPPNPFLPPFPPLNTVCAVPQLPVDRFVVNDRVQTLAVVVNDRVQTLAVVVNDRVQTLAVVVNDRVQTFSTVLSFGVGFGPP